MDVFKTPPHFLVPIWSSVDIPPFGTPGRTPLHSSLLIPFQLLHANAGYSLFLFPLLLPAGGISVCHDTLVGPNLVTCLLTQCLRLSMSFPQRDREIVVPPSAPLAERALTVPSGAHALPSVPLSCWSVVCGVPMGSSVFTSTDLQRPPFSQSFSACS